MFDHFPEKMTPEANHAPESNDVRNPRAFSYLRFSTPTQGKEGKDSTRRQEKARDDWLARNPTIPLDTSLTLRDEGISGFTGEHRENPDRHGMACFLEAVRQGVVKKGDYLLLENLDRLTREDTVPAVNLFTGILLTGVKIIQLSPVEQVYQASDDMPRIMYAVMELSRGNSESRIKSERLGSLWKNKREKLGKGEKRVQTGRVPGWVKVEGQKLTTIPERVEVVRRIFQLAREGSGVTTISKILNSEYVPGFQRWHPPLLWPVWSMSTVYKLLTSRAVLGEYQPGTEHKTGGKRIKAGEVVKDYYPVVVTEAEFYSAQAALSDRRAAGAGRKSKHVNIFQGLLVDARDGGSLTINHAKRRPPSLIPYNAKRGVPGAVGTSFPLDIFERAIVAELVEIRLADIMPKAAGSKIATLAAKKDEAAGRLKKLKSLLVETDDTAELVEAVRDLGKKVRQLDDELDKAKEEEASPLAEGWGKLRTVAEYMEANGWDDASRNRLRSAMLRVVDEVRCLFVKTEKSLNGQKVAAIALKFKGTTQIRQFWITHRPACAGLSHGTKKWSKAAETEVHSHAWAAPDDDYNLSTTAGAKAIEQLILTLAKHGPPINS